MPRILLALATGLVVAGILAALSASNGTPPGVLAGGGLTMFVVVTAVAWAGLALARLPRPRPRPVLVRDDEAAAAVPAAEGAGAGGGGGGGRWSRTPPPARRPGRRGTPPGPG